MTDSVEPTSADAVVSTRRWWQLGLIFFIIFELYVAARGLQLFIGLWAPLVLVGSMILRMGITFMVGSFLYALLILEWPGSLAMAFSAPAVIFMFPKLLLDIAGFAGWVSRQHER